MRPLKLCVTIALAALLASCGQMPRAPASMLEQIEAAEVTAQQLGASITNLTCTQFITQRCVEPGKAFSPDIGLRLHGKVQDARSALRTAKTLGAGDVAECLGQTRGQAACLSAVRALLGELERTVLQAQGAKP